MQTLRHPDLAVKHLWASLFNWHKVLDRHSFGECLVIVGSVLNECIILGQLKQSCRLGEWECFDLSDKSTWSGTSVTELCICARVAHSFELLIGLRHHEHRRKCHIW